MNLSQDSSSSSSMTPYYIHRRILLNPHLHKDKWEDQYHCIQVSCRDQSFNYISRFTILFKRRHLDDSKKEEPVTGRPSLSYGWSSSGVASDLQRATSGDWWRVEVRSLLYWFTMNPKSCSWSYKYTSNANDSRIELNSHTIINLYDKYVTNQFRRWRSFSKVLTVEYLAVVSLQHIL